jgi:hypothetical protein
MLFDIIEDEFIKDLLDFVVVTTINGKNASEDITSMVDSFVNRLLALDFLLVLVPPLCIGVKEVDIVVSTAGLNMGDVRSRSSEKDQLVSPPAEHSSSPWPWSISNLSSFLFLWG